MQRQIIYRCSRTGMNVQHQLDDAALQRPAENIRVSVRCPACASLHFVNAVTGKLLGDRSGPPPHVRHSA
ncbi:hypothetical protein L6654_39845 [Bradyrhizobium sp. WYCCWR 13023]|uniref:Uncharacterized protein n=1 Tax=Bradyrhizobium zhengyangense TaxID=2911009 RepID=A0A9X1RKF8_9BRAD|nr:MULTISPECIES: hypothetical protein [Bradyrhizobium]MCG2632753.1 hypothetical protein [Bradyrhizobium zhengyangense]MCG2671733.1 hypothetical protein [Bradyrhizobium zhengyangense]MDA9521993.1 hypothetical protein [Bradyrhizobium sp. CCBAU 11434]